MAPRTRADGTRSGRRSAAIVEVAGGGPLHPTVRPTTALADSRGRPVASRLRAIPVLTEIARGPRPGPGA